MSVNDQVWAILRVKDEADILEYTLDHLAAEGVDGVWIIDNASTDGTREIIERFHDKHMAAGDPRLWGPPIVAWGTDEEVGYYQSAKMTGLAKMAACHPIPIQSSASTWIVPVDADELWTVAAVPLAEYLRSLPSGVDVVQGALYNHFPTSEDDPYERNPFLRIKFHDKAIAPLPKVAMRWRDDMTIEQGNHSVSAPAHLTVQTPRVDGIIIHHFPWRSPEQFERKIRNGAAAYAATDLPEEMGAHWRQYGSVLEHGGPEALAEVFHTWFSDPTEVILMNDPAPFCRQR